MGTNSTNGFIQKIYNEEEKKTERKLFGMDFSGVILAAKAQLVEKKKSPSVKTEEFDISTKEKIAIFPLSEGKYIKNADNTTVRFDMTYEEIKSKKVIPSLVNGNIIPVPYTYFIILYVLVGEEIIRLKISGAGRGNFFTHSSNAAKLGGKIHNFVTKFETYVDTEIGKKTAKFSIEKDENGNTINVDLDEIRQYRVELFNKFKPYQTAISAPVQKAQIEQPKNNTWGGMTDNQKFDQTFGEDAPKDELPTINLEEETKTSELPGL